MLRSNKKLTIPARAVRTMLVMTAAASLAVAGLVTPATPAQAFIPLYYLDEDQELASYTGEFKYLDEQTSGSNLSGWYHCRTVTDIGPLTITNDTTILMSSTCRLTAEGASQHQPGIRVNPNASLTIYGNNPGFPGQITAKGGPSAPGIGHAAPSQGTGTLPRPGDITIAGGHITAQGGTNGAGIGNGFRMAGGTITITGGNVIATGGLYAAGIGGGSQAGAGDVLIRHGEVTANGGINAPGIGSGGDFYGATSVTINRSATVTANGRGASPGIGVTAHYPNQRGLPDIDIATRGVVTANPGPNTSVRVGITKSGTDGANVETVNQDMLWLVRTTADGRGTLLPTEIPSALGNPAALEPGELVEYTFGYPVDHGSLAVNSSPDTGYDRLSLTLDGEAAANINSHTFSPLSGHHHLSAIFGEITTATEVEVNLEAPVVGTELPSTATTDGGHAVESLSWSPDHVTAAGATSYTAHVVLAPALGYEFDASTAVTFNGQTATTTQSEADGSLTATYQFPATDALIDDVELYIDSPVFDEELPTLATTTDTRYTVDALTWTPADSTASSATVYTASVTLAPHTGQLFTGSTSASVNDESADVHLEDDGTVTVTYEFPATASLIGSVNLDIDAPVFKEALATAATTTDTNYTVGPLTWSPVHTEAGSNTEYTASVTLTPDAGYAFADSTTASVNDNSANANLEGDGTLTVTYEFPATDTGISWVNIEIEWPTFGEPLTTVATTDDPNISMGEVTWSPDHEIGGSATAYTATVTITPDDGYAFNDVVNVRLYGYYASTEHEADGSLTATHTFYPTATWLPEIDLDIDAPVFSEPLATASIDWDSPPHLASLEWTPNHTVAESGTTYTATGTVLAGEGLVLNEDTTVMVKGHNATVQFEDGWELTFEYTFPATDTWIATTELEIDAPAVGETLADRATTADAHYSAGEVTWTPAHSPATPVTGYSATVVLTPDAGYVFDDTTAASMNGHPTTATLEADGTLTVTYEFPATDRDSVDVVLTGLDTEYTYGDAPFTVSATATPNNAPGGGVAPMSFTPSSFSPAALIPVTFTSSDPTVATVTDNGDNTATVTILRAGTFTLSATTEPTSTLHGTRVDTEITILESTPSVTATEVDGTIHVSVIGAGATPAGTVSVYVGTDVLAADVPLIDGAATVALDGLPAGESTLTIRFDGDAGFYAATEADQLSVTIAAEQTATDNEDGSGAEGEDSSGAAAESGTDSEGQSASGAESDGLPVTGGTAQYGLIAAAVALLFLGVMLALIRQRRLHDTDLA